MSSVDAIVADGWQAQQSGNAIVAEQMYRTALHQDPGHVRGTLLLAGLLRQTGRAPEGLQIAQHLARLDPDNADCHLEIAQCQRAVGQGDAALATLQRAVEVNPASAQTHLQLARTLLAMYRPQDAHDAVARGLEAVPEDPELTGLLGSVLLEMGQPERAIDAFEKAISVQSTPSILNYQLGLAFQQSGKLDEAAEVFQGIVDAYPHFVDAHVGLADIDLSRGDATQAEQRLRELIQNDRVTTPLVLTFTRVCRRLKKPDDAIQLIERVVAHGSITPAVRAQLLLRLGQLCEDKGNYDRAFDAYRQGKSAYPRTYDPAGRVAFAGLLEELFPPSVMDAMVQANLPESERAIFIVGMPRSGTSLVEQILSSHPEVHGAGELDDLRAVVMSIGDDFNFEQGFPWCIPHLTAEQAEAIGRKYLARLEAKNSDARYVTDKMPHNYTFLGVIHAVLPKARIIHCVRDAVDTCLSCFATPLGPMHDFSVDLPSVAHEYRVYRRIMNHWKNVVGVPILDVSYEALVADQETETRRLLEFLDLPWDDACLQFHRTERVAATWSIDQVSQPIYTKSVGRAAKFGRHLDPLRQALFG